MVADNIKINPEVLTPPLIEITYSQLVRLRNNNNLIPGQQYRITDYNCTTTQENTQSANHLFDIIVVADAVNKLNENARAIQHSGDTYFNGCKLEAWQLKYCLNNDTSRFIWADSNNGKGVIYYMKDEWNNECPYDFKNIMFKRPLSDGEYDPNGDDTWVYTFNWTDINDNTSDLSVEQFVHPNDEEGYNNTYGNIIRDYRLDYSTGNFGPLRLNNIVFLSSENYDMGFYYGCYSNIFGDNCHNNTFGNQCYYNIFSIECYNNTFGNFCTFNTFGNKCHDNIFNIKCNYKHLEYTSNKTSDISGDTPEFWFNGEKKW